MASRKTYHVTPGPDGAWRVKAEVPLVPQAPTIRR